MDAGRVFRCFCSRREVREAASAQHGELPEGFYPGTCLALSDAESQRRADGGEEFALRLRAERVEVTVRDRLHGERTDVVDDLVLRRRDGAWAYNLAVVVDDADQGVGEVVRGDDLLPSTAGQAHLCDLLGLKRPAWAHVPLVLGPDGSRLAKRHGAVTLRDLAAARGWEPADAVSWMAGSLGMAERRRARQRRRPGRPLRSRGRCRGNRPPSNRRAHSGFAQTWRPRTAYMPVLGRHVPIPSTPGDPTARADDLVSRLRRRADVAQLVEHFTRNEGVSGSNPLVGSAPQPAGSASRVITVRIAARMPRPTFAAGLSEVRSATTHWSA